MLISRAVRAKTAAHFLGPRPLSPTTNDVQQPLEEGTFMKAIQIAINSGSDNYKPGVIALGEDGRVYHRPLNAPDGAWGVFPELPEPTQQA